MENTFEYDVAFSFCAEDENTARQINEILKERLSTFLYSERQKEIAGRDGEQAFSEVFSTKSRIVVILFRGKWGTTPWTRIEMDSIRNRAHDEGYGFTVLVPLEDGVQIPKWYPKSYLWVGLSRYGIDGAASVIESKVTEHGGEVKEETAESKARALASKLAFREERRTILESSKALELAEVTYDNLVNSIEILLLKIQKENGRFTFEKEEQRRAKIFALAGYSLITNWKRYYSNSLSESSLEISFWSGRAGFHNRIHYLGSEPRKVSTENFQFDYDESKEYGWSLSSKKFYTNAILSQHLVMKLIDFINKHRD